jgi:hypothetical protein
MISFHDGRPAAAGFAALDAAALGFAAAFALAAAGFFVVVAGFLTVAARLVVGAAAGEDIALSSEGQAADKTSPIYIGDRWPHSVAVLTFAFVDCPLETTRRVLHVTHEA